jgi:hypothetical protein
MATATIDMVGVSFLRDGANGWYTDAIICLCSCGRRFNSTKDKKESLTCECGNKYFKLISRPSKNVKTNIGGIFECTESTNNSFKIKKTELIANIVVDEEKSSYYRKADDFAVTFSTAKEYTLDYSLRDKRYDVYCGDKLLEKDGKDKDLFFRGKIDKNELLDCIDNEALKYILKFAFDYLGKVRDQKIKKWSIALERLFKNPYIELLNNCGLGRHLGYIYQRYNYYGNLKMIEGFTKPHEFFQVPKYMMKYIKEIQSVSDQMLNAFRNFDKTFDSNKFQVIMQIFKEESTLDILYNNSSIITELYSKYGYKDIKKLAIYVTRDAKLQQGIMRPTEALTLLRDYAKMSTNMEIPYDKFPKSLKKEHDVTAMNYKVVENEMKNKEFSQAIGLYESLAYTTKKDLYEIILPTSASDLVKEGSALNHCIASYVDNVIAGSCQIVFLRWKEDIDKPFISIEIRDGNIRQARGQSNKSITNEYYEEPHEFFVKWAEKNELQINLW